MYLTIVSHYVLTKNNVNSLFPQSVLYLVSSLHFVPGLQSAFCTDRILSHQNVRSTKAKKLREELQVLH